MEALLQVHFEGFIPGTSRAGYLAIFFEDVVEALQDGSWPYVNPNFSKEPRHRAVRLRLKRSLRFCRA